DDTSAFRARVSLAAVREGKGDLAGAIALLEAAVAEDVVHPAEHVDVFAQLGRAYAGIGRTAQAVSLFERCLEQCGDSPASEARYAALLSYALTDAGDIARAEQVV